MQDWITVAGLTLLAGLAMPVGAQIARIERIKPDWLETELRHSIVAFGGGALLAAVALVLVPKGVHNQNYLIVTVSFMSGGIAFLAIDVILASLQTSASQLAAMLADFIPEALALGAGFASSHETGLLLAMLIALQNLPEGFNAYRELIFVSHFSARRILILFTIMSLVGPAAGLAGYFWLSPYPEAISSLMLFASGGILYLVFQDIAPQAQLRQHWAPPLGAVLGFLLGLIGDMLITRNA